MVAIEYLNRWEKWKISIKALPITILVLTLTMSIGALIILWSQRIKDNLIVSTNETQLGRTATILFEMRHNEYRRLVYDYSFWDELYEYSSRPSSEWAKNNLDAYINSYKVNATYVFNRNNELVYFASDSLFSKLPKEIIDNKILKSISKEKLTQTFINYNNTLVEITGATIHKTSDEQRSGTPNGILIACKIWDNNILEIFSNAILGEAEFTQVPLKSDLQHAQIRYNLPVKNLEGKTITYLTLTKSIKGITEARSLTTNIAYLTLALALIATIILFVIIRRLIGRPLNLLAQIISTKNPHQIENLKHYGTQFRDLGEIIDAYMRQSEELKIALDKAKESDRLKSAFLSNMSHEIRTPLNGIIGFSQLVCRPNISDEKRASFQKTIARCGEDLIKTISDILDISKIELRQIKITPTWFSVFELFEELETFYPIILADHQKEHLKIIFITPAHDTNIFLDKAKIKQSLINLITNAIKYTNEGSIEVSFRIKERVIIFEVKDTGPGIRSEDQKMLFQLFSQIKNDNTKLHGAGLGLAIAKGLTSLQNGTIKFKSEMGKGTTFRISIPLNLAKKIKKQEIN